MNKAFIIWLLVCAASSAQQIPNPTDLPGDPFFIKKSWELPGNRDTLSSIALDTVQLRLILAFRHRVVVREFDSPTILGTVSGIEDATGIALDDTGEFGFISEGRLNRIDVFDRRAFNVVGIIPTAANPSFVVFEPISALLFVVCRESVADVSPPPPSPGKSATPRIPAPPHPRNLPTKPVPPPEFKWSLTVIDANTWNALANIQLPGMVGVAHTAGGGHVYLTFPQRDEVARVDAAELRQWLDNQTPDPQIAQQPTPKDEQLRAGHPIYSALQSQRTPIRALNWSNDNAGRSDSRQIAFFRLDRSEPQCGEPRALAADERHLRLFVACSKMKLAVLNADNGDPIATLPTGPDTNAVAYDFDHRLIFAANGGNGSLTIITQDSTDTYAVVQNLPIPLWARALAVNPANGQTYLLTDYSDADSQDRQASQIKGSFLLLLIGH
jgi:DNA-binding beta-propeller fold protein YncE